jgi:hemerythrin
MDQFVLTDALLTGVPDIDNQHRMLFKIANQIVEPSAASGGGMLFLQLIAFLAGYVEYHFAGEELAMRQANYPGIDKHVRWHAMFRKEVENIALEAQLSGVSQPLVLRVSHAIQNWLSDHICVTDRQLADFLISRAATESVGLPAEHELRKAGMIPSSFDLAAYADKRIG